jgi:4-amino-4-deoxy-L-arabinose transferase-like glycosyltransferase
MKGVAVSVFLLACLMRGVFLTADPPPETISGISWYDEGRWTHNARNKVLFGAWQADHYNAIPFLSPPFTVAAYAAFSGFGVGTWQARVLSVAAGVGLVACLYALLNRQYGIRAGLIGLALAGTDYMLVMYSRVALVDMLLLFLMVLSAYCFVRGRHSDWFAVAAGMAAAAVGVTKALWWGFLAVPLATGLLLGVREGSVEGWRRERRRLGRYAFGLSLVTIPWLVFWLSPHWDEIAGQHLYHARLYAPRKITGGYLSHIALFPFAHPVFARALPVTMVGLLVAWTVLTGQPRRTAGEWEPAVLFVGWLILGVLLILAFDLYNQRRYAMLLPPLIGLTAIGLAGGAKTEAGVSSEPSPITSRLRRWACAGAGAYGLYWMCGAVLRLGAFDLEKTGLQFRHMAMGAGGAAVLVWIAANRRTDTIEGWRRRLSRPVAVTVIVTAALGANLWQYGQWAAGRSYTIYETSRTLDDLIPPGSYVFTDDGTVSLSWENRMRPLFVHNWYGLLGDASVAAAAGEQGARRLSSPDGIPLDPRQRAETRFILLLSTTYEGAADSEQAKLLAEILPGPPSRVFGLYDWYRPGKPEQVLLFERRTATEGKAP